MPGIRAKSYGEVESILAADPCVMAMAIGLKGVAREQLVHEGDGEVVARFEFMMGANREFAARVEKLKKLSPGYEDPTKGMGLHIGAVANALLLILDRIAVMEAAAEGKG
jgi:hypothetical protein